MAKLNTSVAGFALDVNVNIQVLDRTHTVRKEINKHNRATKQMLEGMLGFLRGDYNTTNRQMDYNSIEKVHKARNYIPCYVGVGTYGIRTIDGLPDYDVSNRRNPPLEEGYNDDPLTWSRFTDTHLAKEVDATTRYEIGVLDEASLDIDNVVVDSVQFVLGTEIAPNYFTSAAYGTSTDIFITELGLFSTPTPNDGNLLARVTLHDTYDPVTGETHNEILYVRPQDTIILRWTICLISLSDLSQTSDTPDTTANVDMGINGLTITNEVEGG